MRSFSKLVRRTSTLAFKTIPLFKNPVVFNQNPASFKLNYQFSNSKSYSQNILKSNYEGNGFYVEQMLVGCLAIYSYYVESNGEAIIIDPQNDISQYS